MLDRRGHMMVNVGGVAPDYFWCRALEDATFHIFIARYVNLANLSYIEYSLDEGVSWTRILNNGDDATAVNHTTPTVKAGDRILWRGQGTCTSNSYNVNENRSSFIRGSGKYDIGGVLATLLFGDKATIKTEITNGHEFSGLFRGDVNVVGASSLVLPPMKGTYGFTRMFAGCVNFQYPPVLPQTELRNRCYDQMFADCNLATAPELPARRMINGCYSRMFLNNKNLSYIKMLATDNMSVNAALNDWVSGIADNGIFVKHIDATWTTTGASGVPNNWTVIYYDPALDKYYIDQTRETECDMYGNIILVGGGGNIIKSWLLRPYNERRAA